MNLIHELQRLANEVIELERLRAQHCRKRKQSVGKLEAIRTRIEVLNRQQQTSRAIDFKPDCIPMSASDRTMTAALQALPSHPVLSVVRSNTMRLRYHGDDLPEAYRKALMRAAGSFIRLATGHPCPKSKYTATCNGRALNLVCRRCGKVVFTGQIRSLKNA